MFPPIEAVLFFGVRYVTRALDQRKLYPNDYKGTNCRSVEAFIDVYSGPEFQAHYKYSATLNIIFVTFLYGCGIPLLFPLAVL